MTVDPGPLMTDTLDGDPPDREPGGRENPLSDYLETGYEAIAGWLWPPALEATLTLADVQATLVPPGPVCEIGVWEGRYLSLLSFVSATPQPVLGIDPLVHGGDRQAQRARLRHNICQYARRPDLVTILERYSREVSAETILSALGSPCQFVSVDGDHSAEGALNDLHLAEAIVAPGGIVAVDDVPNMACPGVTEAVVRYGTSDTSPLAPFLHVSNKLFLTHRSWCDRYRHAILERIRSGDTGEWGQRTLTHLESMRNLDVPVRFLGQDLLVAA